MAKKPLVHDEVDDIDFVMGPGTAPKATLGPLPRPDAGQTAARIAQLRDDHAKAVRLHAQAEAAVQSVKDQLAKAEGQLRELGIDPANAEAELRAAEEQLEQMTTELAAALQKATVQYQTIIDAARAALGG